MMMASRTNHPVEEAAGCSDSDVKIVEWEELQQELARLWSLSSALRTAKETKADLALKLEAVIEERNAYLKQLNEIEDKRRKLEDQNLFMGQLLLRAKRSSEQTNYQRDQLCSDVRRLMTASKSLSGAHQQMQEANKLLSGENGYGSLCYLWSMMRARRQYMVAQVSTIYPVKESLKQSSGGTLDLNRGKSGDQVSLSPSDTSRSNQRSTTLTIAGVQLSTPFLKKPSFFPDKKELQKSAIALGYISHAVRLIAAYLDVPLRYPIKIFGSRSYVLDHAPSFEPTTSVGLASNSMLKPVEFPLFLEGQESTRAAYAVFLLNKDIEQLLNSMGTESLGPRSVLPNLMELLKIIHSEEFIKMQFPRISPSISLSGSTASEELPRKVGNLRKYPQKGPEICSKGREIYTSKLA